MKKFNNDKIKKEAEFKKSNENEKSLECLKAILIIEKALQQPLNNIDLMTIPPRNPLKFGKLGLERTQRRFEKLFKILERQKTIISEKIQILKIAPNDNLSNHYNKLLQKTKDDLEYAQNCHKTNQKCPNVTTKQIPLIKEVRNMEIPFNKIKVFINSATFRKKTPKKFDLVHSFVFGGDANPQETGKFQVAAKVDNEKTVVPINKSIMLSVTRKKGLSLKMRKAKIDFVLVQKGIFKDKKIGKCQLKLSNLVGEVDLEKKLKIENNNNVIGEIEVVASVNVPFGKLKLTNVGFKFCVVRRSENLKKMGGEKFAKVKISGEKILSEKSKIDNGENLKDLGILEERDEIDHNILGGKAKINEKISPLMINDPLNVSFYISNDVLELIKSEKTEQMEKLTSNGKAPDQNLCSQLREATIILAKLEKSVEDEEIDLDGYLKSVRKSVKNLEILAQFLETENRPELEEVLRRLVVMKKELETAKTQLII